MTSRRDIVYLVSGAGQEPGIRPWRFDRGGTVKDQRGAGLDAEEEFAARAALHWTDLLDIERGTRNVSLVNIGASDQGLSVTIFQGCSGSWVERGLAWSSVGSGGPDGDRSARAAALHGMGSV